jgi:hypothetical protein
VGHYPLPIKITKGDFNPYNKGYNKQFEVDHPTKENRSRL